MLNKFFVLFATCFAFSGHATHYQVQDLGVWTAKESIPTAINDNGDVIGYMKVGKEQKVFIWHKDSGLTIIDGIPAGAYPADINNRGQITGHFFSWDGWFFPEWVLHAFTWSKQDGYRDIGTIGSKNTSALNINDDGTLLLLTSEYQCYLWKNGNITKLDGASNIVVDTGYDIVNAVINNKGQLAGVRKHTIDNKTQIIPFLLNVHTTASHPLFNKVVGAPYIQDINERGEIVGFFSSLGRTMGFLLNQQGRETKIPNFMPISINDHGIAVGKIIENQDTLGGIYENGQLISIHSLLENDNDQPYLFDRIIGLRDINNQGEIIGTVLIWDAPQAVLLTPVQDPVEIEVPATSEVVVGPEGALVNDETTADNNEIVPPVISEEATINGDEAITTDETPIQNDEANLNDNSATVPPVISEEGIDNSETAIVDEPTVIHDETKVNDNNEEVPLVINEEAPPKNDEAVIAVANDDIKANDNNEEVPLAISEEVTTKNDEGVIVDEPAVIHDETKVNDNNEAAPPAISEEATAKNDEVVIVDEPAVIHDETKVNDNNEAAPSAISEEATAKNDEAIIADEPAAIHDETKVNDNNETVPPAISEEASAKNDEAAIHNDETKLADHSEAAPSVNEEASANVVEAVTPNEPAVVENDVTKTTAIIEEASIANSQEANTSGNSTVSSEATNVVNNESTSTAIEEAVRTNIPEDSAQEIGAVSQEVLPAISHETLPTAISEEVAIANSAIINS